MNIFKKYLMLLLLCLATLPAMANHPDVENYKIGIAFILAVFITYALLKPIKTKSFISKMVIAALFFTGILSFFLGITYILSM